MAKTKKTLLVQVNFGTRAFSLQEEQSPEAFKKKVEGLYRLYWSGLVSVFYKEFQPDTDKLLGINNVYITTKGEEFLEDTLSQDHWPFQRDITANSTIKLLLVPSPQRTATR